MRDMCAKIASVLPPPPGSIVDNLVVIRRTDAAGYGVFATRDTPRGTKIAEESYLVFISTGSEKSDDDKSPSEFCKALSNVSNADYLSLLDSMHCDPSTLESVKKHAIRNEIYRCCETNIGTESQRPTLKELQAIVDGTCRRYAIFLTNNLSLGPEKGRGLFYFFSRMNHSCAPNIHEFYDAARRRLVMRVIRDVKAGEEICSTYIDFLLPKKQRQKKLARWGFECQCISCTDEGIEQTRMRAVELDDMLDEWLYYKEEILHGDGCAAAMENALDNGPTLDSDDNALKAGEELVELLIQLKLVGEPLFNTYLRCSRCSFAMNKLDTAIRFARLALDIEQFCEGPGGNMSDPDYAQSTLAWIKKLEQEKKTDGRSDSVNAQFSLQRTSRGHPA